MGRMSDVGQACGRDGAGSGPKWASGGARRADGARTAIAAEEKSSPRRHKGHEGGREVGDRSTPTNPRPLSPNPHSDYSRAGRNAPVGATAVAELTPGLVASGSAGGSGAVATP